ncbi:HAD family hydrolase [Halonotius pteroides]|uniref:HAD family hydrolase n=1 Tax=Halonotius pteroides TaxID=268735 RepID=A0A3A6QAZ2_9EURY|nr:HAD family hydrolase [Halonotius pteroides]RJX49541.1 HAD family hydrolase [Halonotius pteroides]
MTATAAFVFDLFGTLVAVDDTPQPAAAVADALAARGISVPDDWASAYREPHIDAEEGAEIPLPAHVAAALASRGVDVSDTTAGQAVIDAFEPVVETRAGAVEAVAAAGEAGSVGLLSNCAVPTLVARTLSRSALDDEAFDAIVVSVDCGWRKPDPRAFEAVARQLTVAAAELVVVGDTPATDGGITDCGGEFIDVTETSLPTLQTSLTESQPCR